MADDLAPDGDVFSFEGVSVTFGAAAVLRDVDLRIPASGITVVSGPSGSGKSTLTRLCNRLLDASEGIVRHHGRDVREVDVLALRRDVGMVFQRPTLFDGSVGDNLALTGVADHDAQAAVLDSVGLGTELLGRAADSLSGGEAQRVCLARALLMAPRSLVADEPTTSLDEVATRSLEELVCQLAADGVPILWVTHDQAQAERIADRQVTLEGGRVVRIHPTTGASP